MSESKHLSQGNLLVGIEVPNSEIATVSFRELWEQSQTKAENLLEIPFREGC